MAEEHLKKWQMAWLLLLLLVTILATPARSTNNIGINYGQLGNNLPTPQRARELIQATTISKVKIYDTTPAIIEAFANTGIDLVVMVRNEAIQSLMDAKEATKWVNQNVACYLPATKITAVLVGNEILQAANDGSTQVGDMLVPVMTNIHAALVSLKLDDQVKVSTPHSLAVLSTSYPPSSGAFRDDILDEIMKPMLKFLSATGAPFMVNTYPFFAYKSSPLNVSLAYALFLPNKGILDPKTKLHYYNLMDAQVDAVYSAMARLGYQTIDVIVSETGWPSVGDPAESGASVNNAMVYNRNLINHVTSQGTPLRPNKLMDTYIFALFNENQKPGPTTERNFGLFQPDMTLVYDIGILKTKLPPTVPVTNLPPPSTIVFPPPPYPYTGQGPPPYPVLPSYPPPAPQTPTPVVPAPTTPVPAPTTPIPAPTTPVPTPTTPPYVPAPPSGGDGGTRIWCISKPGCDQGALLSALNFACGDGGADCSQIQNGGPCYNPNTLESHASFAFNMYFHKHGRNFWNCYFNNNALLTVSDPSYGACVYSSQ